MNLARRNVSFDDDSRPVPATGFDFSVLDSDGSEAEDVRRIRLETISRLFQLLTANGAGVACIGQRVLLLAFLSHAIEFKTHRELAVRLRVSRGRVTQRLTKLRKELACLYGENEPRTEKG